MLLPELRTQNMDALSQRMHVSLVRNARVEKNSTHPELPGFTRVEFPSGLRMKLIADLDHRTDGP
jgi:hypothetical protein